MTIKNVQQNEESLEMEPSTATSMLMISTVLHHWALSNETHKVGISSSPSPTVST